MPLRKCRTSTLHQVVSSGHESLRQKKRGLQSERPNIVVVVPTGFREAGFSFAPGICSILAK